MEIITTSSYGIRSWGPFLRRHERLVHYGSLGLILVQCLFPLALIFPNGSVVIVALVAVNLFHLATAAVVTWRSPMSAGVLAMCVAAGLLIVAAIVTQLWARSRKEHDSAVIRLRRLLIMRRGYRLLAPLWIASTWAAIALSGQELGTPTLLVSATASVGLLIAAYQAHRSVGRLHQQLRNAQKAEQPNDAARR